MPRILLCLLVSTLLMPASLVGGCGGGEDVELVADDDVDTGTDTDADTDADSDGDTDSDSDSDTDSNSDSDTDADAGEDSGPDAGGDSGPDAGDGGADAAAAAPILDDTHGTPDGDAWFGKWCYTSGCHSDPAHGTAYALPTCANCHGGNGACYPSTIHHTGTYPPTSCIGASPCHGTFHGYVADSDCIDCHLAAAGTFDCFGEWPYFQDCTNCH
jgi:hypothetical protein